MKAMSLALRALWALGLFALGAAAAAAAIWSMGLEGPRAAMQRVGELAGLRRPDIEAHFNVFLDGGELTYVREQCNPSDTVAPFFLHVIPLDVGDLPVTRKAFGFDNLDFFFDDVGSIQIGACRAKVRLPDYPIDRISTGQYDADGQLWAEEVTLLRTGNPIRNDDIVFRPGETVGLGTHLYALDVKTVALEPFADTGGAIERVGDRLLVATPRGRFATVGTDGQLSYLAARVPMSNHPAIGAVTFRVMDILVGEGRVAEMGSRDHALFVTHHFFNGDCVLFRLSATTLRVSDGDIEVLPTWRTVFDAKPCLVPPFSGNEAGGRMLADGSGHLLVTVGHFGQDTGQPGSPAPSQDSALHLGKVLRVDLATGVAAIHTLGHRNPQGLTRDGHGDVWLTEHGAQGGDELNLIEPGANYGWPEVSYGYQYPRVTLKPDERGPGQHEGFIKPTFAWVPSVGISAIVANDAAAFPLWRDDLLIASLWGRSHGFSLFRVRHRERQVKYVERIEIGHQIRDLAHGPDGHLALLLDIARVLLVRRSDRWCGVGPPNYVHAVHCAPDLARQPAPPPRRPPLATTALPADAEAGEGSRLYGRHCGGCHHLEEERYSLGPHLVGIVGRRTGADAMASPALARRDTVWDEDSLRRFILDPASFAPGTPMPASDVTAAEADAIVAYIARRNAALAAGSD